MVRKHPRAILSPRQWVILAALLALAVFAASYANRAMDNRELQEEVARWEEELSLAQQRLQQSQELLQAVQSDEYVIDAARTELRWAFPDEVLVVTADELSSPSTTLAQTSDAEAVPAWRLWWQRFFGS